MFGEPMGYASEEEICRVLKKKNLSRYPDPTELKPLAQALWILEVSKDQTPFNKLTAKAISYILSELREIYLDEKTIIRAFARADNKVKAHKEGTLVYYEIMASGRRFLRARDTPSTNSEVFFFSGKESWSDSNKKFPKIVELLEGNLCIVDPFYGNGTFHTLSSFGKTKRVRFLSAELGRDEQTNLVQFNTNLQKFKAEFRNIEMRRYPNRYELHDRYVIAQNALVIIGHGIKDLAGKESFVIFLPKNKVGEFLPGLKAFFEKRWRASATI